MTNWGSYYKLGELSLQNRTAVTNWGKIYYKLGQVLQISAVVANRGIADTTVKDIINIFRLKKENETTKGRIIRDIRNLFEHFINQ